MSPKVVVASGYFNPLHWGHVSYLQKAKDLGKTLIVIVNNDKQVALRGDSQNKRPTMPARDRVKLIRSLACVDAAIESVDEDLSVAKTLRLLHPDIFAEGAKQTPTEAEAAVCADLGIEVCAGLGVEMVTLTPYTQNYDWGKPRRNSIVAQLSGNQEGDMSPDEDEKPYAELWIGDHPSGPSSVKAAGNPNLSNMLKRTPSVLGQKLSGEARLPFLLKVLSIHKALSIQAHPDRGRATRLHAERPEVYKDPNHKPEIAIALTDFEAMCGFRPLPELALLVEVVPELRAMVGEDAAHRLKTAIGDSAKEEAALRKAYSHMMHTADEAMRIQLRKLIARAAKATVSPSCTPVYERSSSPTAAPETCTFFPPARAVADIPEVSATQREVLTNLLPTIYELVGRLHSQFGEDIGIFSVFFLNVLKMGVGECLYMPQNTPHAYISGDIVECMACSDNVVRGGLTPKFKDIEVLCEMLHYRGGTPPKIDPQVLAPGVNLYTDKELDEFQVTHVHLGDGERFRTCFSNLGPSVAVALRGTGSVTISSEITDVKPGTVFFLSAGADAELFASKEMDVFAACCPPHYFNDDRLRSKSGGSRRASPSPSPSI